MDQKLYEKLCGAPWLASYVETRSGSFLSMDYASARESRRATRDPFSGTDPLLVLDALFVDGSLPALPAEDDTEALREAKLLFRRALESSDDDGSDWDADLPDEIAGALGDSDSGEDEPLRWLLRAVTCLAASSSGLDLNGCVSALARVQDRPGYTEELACALSFSAIWSQKSGARAAEIDRYLSRAFGLAGISDVQEMRPLFMALTKRMSFPGAPRYGPGAGLGGRAGTLRNALSLADRLPDPDLVCMPVGYLLGEIGAVTLSQDDLRRALGPEGLPDVLPLRFAWGALEAAVVGMRSPKPHASLGLEAFERLVSGGAVAALGDKVAWTAYRTVARATLAFSRIFGGLPPEDAERAVRLVAPLRVGGQVAPWAFQALFERLKAASPHAFQAAVMRTAADGLFGYGEALVQAVVLASCIPSKDAVRLASFTNEAEALRRKAAGTRRAQGPLGARLAAALIDAELAARTEAEPDAAFRALAAICPDPPEGPEVLEERQLFLFAYAAALVAASWGPAGVDGPGTAAEGDTEDQAGGDAKDHAGGDAEDHAGGDAKYPADAGTAATDRDAVPAPSPEEEYLRSLIATAREARLKEAGSSGPPDYWKSGWIWRSTRDRLTPEAPHLALQDSRLARLIKLCPAAAMEDPAFQDKILPGAMYVALGSAEGNSDRGSLILASAPDMSGLPERVQVRGALAVYTAMIMGERLPESEEDFRRRLMIALGCLAGELPPRLRVTLVPPCLAGFGHLGLGKPLEGFFEANRLMQVPLAPPGEPPPIDDFEGLPGDPARRISYPGPIRSRQRGADRFEDPDDDGDGLGALRLPGFVEDDEDAEGEEFEDAEDLEEAEDLEDAEDPEDSEDSEDAEDLEDAEDPEDSEDAEDPEGPGNSEDAEGRKFGDGAGDAAGAGEVGARAGRGNGAGDGGTGPGGVGGATEGPEAGRDEGASAAAEEASVAEPDPCDDPDTPTGARVFSLVRAAVGVEAAPPAARVSGVPLTGLARTFRALAQSIRSDEAASAAMERLAAARSAVVAVADLAFTAVGPAIRQDADDAALTAGADPPLTDEVPAGSDGPEVAPAAGGGGVASVPRPRLSSELEYHEWLGFRSEDEYLAAVADQSRPEESGTGGGSGEDAGDGDIGGLGEDDGDGGIGGLEQDDDDGGIGGFGEDEDEDEDEGEGGTDGTGSDPLAESLRTIDEILGIGNFEDDIDDDDVDEGDADEEDPDYDGSLAAQLVSISTVNRFPITVYAVCCTECGMYQTALQTMMMDRPINNTLIPLKRIALDRIAEGLAKSGKIESARMALRMLDVFGHMQDDHSISLRARRIVNAALKPARKKPQKPKRPKQQLKKGGKKKGPAKGGSKGKGGGKRR
jgi:hypothetical protein